MPPAKHAPKKYRVLFTDGASYGRFEDVEAPTEAEAAWKVALGIETGTFKGIFPIPATED